MGTANLNIPSGRAADRTARKEKLVIKNHFYRYWLNSVQEMSTVFERNLPAHPAWVFSAGKALTPGYLARSFASTGLL